MERTKWNEYQKNYSKNHYKSLSALLDVELINKFKTKLKSDGITVASFLRDAIEKYLGSNI